jgi:hypothetical protein
MRGSKTRPREAISANDNPCKPMLAANAVAVHRLQYRISPRLKNFDGHESVAAGTLTGKLSRHRLNTLCIRG